jgi:endoglucanase
MDDRQIDLLKSLTESFGPSGFERETASIVISALDEIGISSEVNRLGSVTFEDRGTSDRPLVLIPGHIDEVGFCVTGIHKDTGFLTFEQLGGWFDQVLLGQRVTVRSSKGDLTGVISATPPHIIPPEERKKVVTKDKMYIDIGTTSKDETEGLGIRIGDPVVPLSPFSLIREGNIAMGKAFDDRVGTFVAMEAVRRLRDEDHPNTAMGAATTQEEVGCRGAKTVAQEVSPDVCLTIEVDISGDVPGTTDRIAPARMGKGVSILTLDSSLIPNQPLKEYVIGVAERAKIPYQLSILTKGATDAGPIHVSGIGCPSIVLGIPTRHIHSHVGILDLRDVEVMVDLVVECVKGLDEETVSSFTRP